MGSGSGKRTAAGGQEGGPRKSSRATASSGLGAAVQTSKLEHAKLELHKECERHKQRAEQALEDKQSLLAEYTEYKQRAEEDLRAKLDALENKYRQRAEMTEGALRAELAAHKQLLQKEAASREELAACKQRAERTEMDLRMEIRAYKQRADELDVRFNCLQEGHDKTEALYRELNARHQSVLEERARLQQQVDREVGRKKKYLAAAQRGNRFLQVDERWAQAIPDADLKWVIDSHTKGLNRLKAELERRLRHLAMERVEHPMRRQLECPITQALMQDPVSTSDGHTFERYAIERHFTHNGLTSPLTNLTVTRDLRPNCVVKSMIQQMITEQLGKWSEARDWPFPVNTTPRAVVDVFSENWPSVAGQGQVVGVDQSGLDDV